MSDDAAAGHGHDSLIIKRGGGGHHDEHHGGVWKIAFADFMTAMMAFFLVMWLISANDKTKAVIAKYFNPIELVDSTPQPRGLSDPKKDDPNIEHKSDAKEDTAAGQEEKGVKEQTHGSEGQHAKEEKAAEKAAPAKPSAAPHPDDKPPLDDADHSPSHAEVELIRDPYAVIAEIADKEKKAVEPPKSGAEKPAKPAEGGTGAVGLSHGDGFRDPFEPQPVAAGRDPFALPATRPEAPPPGGAAPPFGGAAPPSDTAAAVGLPEGAGGAGRTEGPGGAGAEVAAAPAAPEAAPSPGAPEPAAKADAPAKEAPAKPLAPAALKAEIVAAARALDPAPSHAAVPAVDVRRTDEGVLISLTDAANYTMFASASARPSARAVALMGTIGKLLRTQKGAIVVRGFTDSRPFRSDVYDNWRLSTERAHIAQYMLVRGGLEDARVDRVEGYADRHPRNPKDPAAAENRRIEILVRGGTP